MISLQDRVEQECGAHRDDIVVGALLLLLSNSVVDSDKEEAYIGLVKVYRQAKIMAHRQKRRDCWVNYERLVSVKTEAHKAGDDIDPERRRELNRIAEKTAPRDYRSTVRDCDRRLAVLLSCSITEAIRMRLQHESGNFEHKDDT